MTTTQVIFTLGLKSGNAAMVEDPHVAVLNVLEAVRDAILEGRDIGTLRDANGNSIGDYELVLIEEEEE